MRNIKITKFNGLRLLLVTPNDELSCRDCYFYDPSQRANPEKNCDFLFDDNKRPLNCGLNIYVIAPLKAPKRC